MSIIEIENKVQSMLDGFMLSYSKLSAFRNQAAYFVITDFGVVIACINPHDYSHISNDVQNNFKGWRQIFISYNDNIAEVRYTVLWELMRCGYMKWLRHKHPRVVRDILTMRENLGQRIIEERLRIWNDNPKYKFLIEDNKAVLRGGSIREFAYDQGFFDYMPEEVISA